MRRILYWILFFILLGVAGYFAYIHNAEFSKLIPVPLYGEVPCSSPLTYSVGSIDSRFGISNATLVKDLAEAEGIWESASGKDLFQYALSGGSVTVDLVYDSRQEAIDRLTAAGLKVDKTKTTYDELKAKYDALAAQLKTEKVEYDSKVSAYRSDENAFNAEVRQANRKGGATPAEYDTLQAKKTALEQKFADLKLAEYVLNEDIRTFNALATTLNQLIAQLNLNVDQYNQAGAAAGEFEEGLYQLENGVQTISIYEFSGHVDLVRVLAHEMGHALGMEHVADQNAIMYKLNSGTNLAATQADVAELNRACAFK